MAEPPAPPPTPTSARPAFAVFGVVQTVGVALDIAAAFAKEKSSVDSSALPITVRVAGAGLTVDGASDAYDDRGRDGSGTSFQQVSSLTNIVDVAAGPSTRSRCSRTETSKRGATTLMVSSATGQP